MNSINLSNARRNPGAAMHALQRTLWRIKGVSSWLALSVAFSAANAQPFSDSSTPWVGDVAISTGLQISSSAPTVRQPNNEYRESNIDLRVVALGGPIDIARSWSQGRWWLNPAWGPLNFELDPLDGTPNVIERAGLLYERSGSSTLFTSKANSYAPVFIRKATITTEAGPLDGWQWYDAIGNTIDYDADGRILGYANPSGINVRFAYDSATQVRILDHLNQLAYTLTLSDGLITKVEDRGGRSVAYTWSGSGANRRLTQVTDVAGEPWRYEYNTDGQITKRIDPLGEQNGDTITVRYAASVPAPAPQLTLGSKGQVYDPAGASGTTRKLKNIWGAGRVWQLTNGRGTETANTQYLKESRQFLVNDTDNRGNNIQTTYDLAGFELKRSFNDKLTHTRTWDGNFSSAVTNARGLVTRYEYDYNRKITKTIYPDGTQDSSQYNDKGLRTQYTNELGVISTWDYDREGRVTKQVEAQGTPEQRTTTWTYNQYGLLTKNVVSKEGNDTAPEAIVTSYTHDSYGNTETITDAEGNVTKISYDAAGNPIAKTDPINRTTRYAYNARNQLIEQTSPMGFSTTVAYDQRGQRIQTTDPLGNTASTSYDKDRRIQSQTDQEGHTTRFEYNQFGDLIKTTSAEGVTNTTSYDNEGRPSVQTDAHGNAISYTYGAKETANADLLVSITYPGNLQTLSQYDQRGRRTVSTQKAGSGSNAGQELKTITTYDSAGRTVATTSPAGKTSQMAYDSRNRIVKATDPDGYSTLYSFDLQDNQTTVTDANQNVHRFAYDKLSRLTQETRPEGGKTNYVYDKASQLTQRTNPDGDTNAIDYDADGRRTKEIKTSHVADAKRKAELSQVVTYQYNAASQTTGYEQKDGTGSLISQASYVLDKLGRNQQEQITYGPTGASQITATIGQTWNGDGQKTSQTYPDGSTASFTYDKGYLKTASQPGTTDQITWTSYDWNLPKTIQYPGATRVNSYDGFYRYQTINAQSTVATPQNILNLAYQYDLDSNITQIQRQVGAAIQGTTNYGYDNLDRLTSASPSQSLKDLGLPDEQYSYDPVGNRLSSASQPGEWKYETGNRLAQWGYEQSQINYGYSQAGNTIKETRTGKIRSYEYDATERLTRVLDDEQTIASYQYDPRNRRISKAVVTGADVVSTYFVYAEEGLIAEIDEIKIQYKTYGWEPNSAWGTKLLWQAEHTQIPKSSTYYFINNDHLGSPQIAVNRAGVETWSMLAESFGRAYISNASIAEILVRFPGQYYDDENGTYYNFYRDYSPDTGRYIERDPIGLNGGVNAFIYSDANPIVFIDELGLKARVCCRKIPGLFGANHCFIDVQENEPDGCGNKCPSPPKIGSISLHGPCGMGSGDCQTRSGEVFMSGTGFDNPSLSTCGSWSTDCQVDACVLRVASAYEKSSFYGIWRSNSNTFSYYVASSCGITSIPGTWNPGGGDPPAGPWAEPNRGDK